MTEYINNVDGTIVCHNFDKNIDCPGCFYAKPENPDIYLCNECGKVFSKQFLKTKI